MAVVAACQRAGASSSRPSAWSLSAVADQFREDEDGGGVAERRQPLDAQRV